MLQINQLRGLGDWRNAHQLLQDQPADTVFALAFADIHTGRYLSTTNG
jgi:hypothetical protein